MKKTIMIAAVLPVFLSGCDFLNCDESSIYTKDEILESYERTKQLVTNVYSYLPNGFCNIGGAMQDAATDDAVHVYRTSVLYRFIDGTWGPDHTVDDVWSTYYEGIRAANRCIAEASDLTFEDWENNDNYEDWMNEYRYYGNEVRFLRAYFYFELIRRYRNVPLVLDVMDPEDVNDIRQSSFDEIAQFIVDECEYLGEEGRLPESFASGFYNNEIGRVTRGAALALRSRMTLYMASPLHSADNKAKWKNAARAAYDIIGNASGFGYSLSQYSALFGAQNILQPEVILARPMGETGTFESANFPIGVTGGKTSTCPTENLVEAYEMTDGSRFDWTDAGMKASPYENRDPRLAMTIAYNDMPWPVNNLEIYEGGSNGLPLNNATVTGYYLKKYVNNEISFEAGSTSTARHHNWILFRYGEILLNYAEAMVNAFDSPTYSDAEFPVSALEAVNMLRNRPGVGMPPYPSDISKEDFIERLKNERRVELAFEGHRFWDVRRWKELDETARIYRVNVTKVSNTFIYEKSLYETRTLSDRMYFYPIPNTEMYKNGNLIQNPNW